MKQYITHHQFDELNEKQQTKMMKRWSKSVGDLVFCKIDSNENVFYGVITEVKDGVAYSSWDMKGSTAPTKQILDSVWYPLFSFGQLVGMLIELYDNSFDFNHKSIDDLWESVKERI